MSVLNGQTGVVNVRRVGNISDPFISIQESVKVIQGRCILKEIPDKFNGVTITNGTTTLSTVDSTSGTLSSPTIVAVDFTQGILNCDPSLEGVTLNVSYKGTGVFALNANRVFSNLDQNNNIVSTLQDYINTAQAPVNQFQLIGVYDPTVQYLINNIITYLGSYYVALVNTKGNAPTLNGNNTYWRYLMGVNTQLSQFTNEVTVTSTVSSVGIGINQFNANNDLLIVHKNTTFMQPNVDYLVSGGSITPVSGSWVGTSSSPLVFDFLVLKNTISTVPTGDGSLLQDNSVGNSKLAADIKVGSLANLTTSTKSDAVSAINENVQRISNIEIFRLMGI